MNKLSTKQQLETIVKAAIGKGWNIPLSEGYILDGWGVEKNYITVRMISRVILAKYKFRDLRVNDLISDPSFMAVFGDREVCIHSGCNRLNCIGKYRVKNSSQTFMCMKSHENINGDNLSLNLHHSSCRYYEVLITASLYHSIEALKLIHAGGDPIDYLFTNLPDEVNNGG